MRWWNVVMSQLLYSLKTTVMIKTFFDNQGFFFITDLWLVVHVATQL